MSPSVFSVHGERVKVQDMANANVLALQSAVNRFAKVAGFAPIAMDGVFGPNTITATYQSLSWIGGGSCAPAGCVDDDDASTGNSLVSRWDQSSASAQGLATFMDGVADEIGLAHIAMPVTT